MSTLIKKSKLNQRSDTSSVPIRLLERGKSLEWDCSSLDFTQDRADLAALPAVDRKVFLSMMYAFMLGEQVVASDLGYLRKALIRQGGYADEVAYLQQQIEEEDRHEELLQLWFAEVVPSDYPPVDLISSISQSRITSEYLPQAMQALESDHSARAMFRATLIYHQVVEGVMAQIGFNIVWHSSNDGEKFPALCELTRNIQVDEARHVAFGTHFARRLLRENPLLVIECCKLMPKLVWEARKNGNGLFDMYEPPYAFGWIRAEEINRAKKLFFRRLKAVFLGA